MDLLTAAKKAKKTGLKFFWYYEDGSRTEYEITKSDLFLDENGDFPSFFIDRLLSKKFTFRDKKPHA